MTNLFENVHKRFLTLDIIKHNQRLRELSEPVCLDRGADFAPSNKYLYIIIEGHMSIYTSPLESFIGLTVEFMPIGLIEMMTPALKLIYIAESSVSLLKISLKNFYKVFHVTHKETEDLIVLITHLCSFLIANKADSITETAYDAIVSMLYRYLYRKEHIPEFNEGIAAFIIKRTGLSKSYVFEVLSELKKGGYIKMSKGKLFSINKKLPLKF
ncbi:helix-turn-helix domain-containing protein [Scandinavium sp. TWS1a]|uniref:helix-turn-helix domain-containing protein n=1 Tax=Scandinavium tedordense TaxID=2926521 RepID=UPI0021668C59|nr:helix-turn-helix domain-containing protein [Scandinavium tedordense]MCS2169596.1 helix-turn-helix domain-containing protein [Scandinavium tedordense]